MAKYLQDIVTLLSLTLLAFNGHLQVVAAFLMLIFMMLHYQKRNSKL
jgi:phage shock protein PspC (stress-responsive transcriptional regulator)